MDTSNPAQPPTKERTIQVRDDEYDLFMTLRMLYKRLTGGKDEEMIIVQIKPTGIKCKRVR